MNNKPLADRMRPTKVDEVAGQRHLLGENKVLRKVIESGKTPNMIFYGPSGVGKTTVANIIAQNSNKKLHYLNATTASTADIKDIIKDSEDEQILLYLDEIQYFNKKQQQILLSYIENGQVSLIAATTENPYFYVYPAILSRSTAFEFKTLSAVDVKDVIDRALCILASDDKVRVTISEELKMRIAQAASGDVRKSLNILEMVITIADDVDGRKHITEDIVNDVVKNNGVRYDKDGEQHYDIISAYQKSMRGSDVDASLYYLGRLLAAGDLPSACRRLLVCANEDVGLAHPNIIPIVKAAVDTAIMVGLPEARLPLANAVILVASSPKSNAAHDAINAVMDDIARGYVGDVPRALQNKHCDGVGGSAGQNYKYPHDYPNHYVKQQYLPDVVKDKKYYHPGDNDTEKKFDNYLKRIKNQK